MASPGGLVLISVSYKFCRAPRGWDTVESLLKVTHCLLKARSPHSLSFSGLSASDSSHMDVLEAWQTQRDSRWPPPSVGEVCLNECTPGMGLYPISLGQWRKCSLLWASLPSCIDITSVFKFASNLSWLQRISVALAKDSAPCVPAPACRANCSPWALTPARAGLRPMLLCFPISKAGGPRSTGKSGLTVWAHVLQAAFMQSPPWLLSFGNTKRGLQQSVVSYFCILKHVSVL